MYAKDHCVSLYCLYSAADWGLPIGAMSRCRRVGSGLVQGSFINLAKTVIQDHKNQTAPIDGDRMNNSARRIQVGFVCSEGMGIAAKQAATALPNYGMSLFAESYRSSGRDTVEDWIPRYNSVSKRTKYGLNMADTGVSLARHRRFMTEPTPFSFSRSARST